MARRRRSYRQRVMLVEDEPDATEVIRHSLVREGFDAILARTGPEVSELIRRVRPVVIVLDLVLPERNGWDFCRRLKCDPGTQAIPIIIVSGRVDEADKVLGFELGADDYITKPFSPRELIARIRALARSRHTAAPSSGRRHLHVGALQIDRDRWEVSLGGRAISVTSIEFELLATLATVPGRGFGREELLAAVWGRHDYVGPHAVDVNVARLRGKFAAAKLPSPVIETVRGVGYRLRER